MMFLVSVSDTTEYIMLSKMQPSVEVSWLCYTGRDGVRPNELYTGDEPYRRLKSVIHYAEKSPSHIVHWWRVVLKNKECHPLCWQGPSYIVHWWWIVPKTKECHPLCRQNRILHTGGGPYPRLKNVIYHADIIYCTTKDCLSDEDVKRVQYMSRNSRYVFWCNYTNYCLPADTFTEMV